MQRPLSALNLVASRTFGIAASTSASCTFKAGHGASWLPSRFLWPPPPLLRLPDDHNAPFTGRNGMEKDMAKALRYSEKACELNHPWGCANAARMYDLGQTAALSTSCPLAYGQGPPWRDSCPAFSLYCQPCPHAVPRYRTQKTRQATARPWTRPRQKSSRKRRGASRRANDLGRISNLIHMAQRASKAVNDCFTNICRRHGGAPLRLRRSWAAGGPRPPPCFAWPAARRPHRRGCSFRAVGCVLSCVVQRGWARETTQSQVRRSLRPVPIPTATFFSSSLAASLVGTPFLCLHRLTRR